VQRGDSEWRSGGDELAENDALRRKLHAPSRREPAPDDDAREEPVRVVLRRPLKLDFRARKPRGKGVPPWIKVEATWAELDAIGGHLPRRKGCSVRASRDELSSCWTKCELTSTWLWRGPSSCHP